MEVFARAKINYDSVPCMCGQLLVPIDPEWEIFRLPPNHSLIFPKCQQWCHIGARCMSSNTTKSFLRNPVTTAANTHANTHANRGEEKCMYMYFCYCEGLIFGLSVLKTISILNKEAQHIWFCNVCTHKYGCTFVI